MTEVTRDELENLARDLDSVVWMAEPDTLRLTSISKHAADVFGYPVARWLDEPSFFASRLHADEREVTLSFCRAVASDGRQRRFVHRFLTADDRVLWVRTVVGARKTGGTITSLLGLTTAVADIAQLERTEREKEAQRLILDQLPAIVWTVDRNLRFSSGSGAGLSSIGLVRDQLVGATIYEYFRVEAPTDPIVGGHLRALSGETTTFEVEWIGRWYQMHIEPFRDRQGELVGTIGVALDMTDRKRAEAERDEQRQLLGALVANMVEPVLFSDLEGRFTLANAAARRLFEELEEPYPTTIDEITARRRLLSPAGRLLGSPELPIARALAGEVVVRQELVVKHRGRDYHLFVSAAPIRAEAGSNEPLGAVAVIRDESERVEFEQVKDQFLRVAAHELKTPVTIMKAHAQGMRRVMGTPEPGVQRMLDALDRGADRITRTVEDLIDISQLQLGTLDLRMEPLELRSLVARTAMQVGRGYPRHELRLLPSADVHVRGDRARLEQCVRILIDNAVKYSPNGGPVQLAVTTDDEHATVSVRDYGVGIPYAKQARIFERFYRAHTDTAHDYGGLGVGLYLLHEIIVRHAGHVSFESVPEQGSTFRFTLPGR